MKMEFVVAACLAVGTFGAASVRGEETAKPAAEAEPKSGTAATGFYPNDLGPAEIDVSAYPKEMRQSYKVFAFKCAACHTIARPINSQFLELSEDEIKKAKTEDPDLFKDEKLVKPEAGIWNRYVKRMMSKPGCPVGKDGKQIFEFLVFDSKIRKTGANAKEWREHRAKLLHEFKEHYPDSFKTVFPDAAK
ncbi:MAG: hypothetical protein PHS14_15880 [Elusimicrobia bacterium]|nr:hypothetical protein [Elusimicrobiota bacterium]